MNIDTDLKQILSYHQSFDDGDFCRNVLYAIQKQQKLRRWIIGACFLLGCIAAIGVLMLMLPADAVFVASNSISFYASIAVSSLLLWVVFEEFDFIR
ncbi:hypothetical protein [Marinicella sp. W31]|uniref:hypothetical protein n=1 Tax=Marinicella sp. W31 TaxID=3023713 RepID=UPI003757957A